MLSLSTFHTAWSYRDWILDDPAGQSLDVVRRTRDDIADRVHALIDEIHRPPPENG